MHRHPYQTRPIARFDKSRRVWDGWAVGLWAWSILPVFWITDHSQPRSSSTASKKSGAEKLGFLLPAPLLIVRYELWADSEPGGVHRIRYLRCGWDEDIPPIPCAVISEPLSDWYIARFLCCEKSSCLSSFSLLPWWQTSKACTAACGPNSRVVV
jgi:hypothetical protein